MPLLRILKDGANKSGQEVNLRKDKTVLGRNPECDIVIAQSSVSREHAQILKVNDNFFVKDLHSRNGTVLNNQRLSPDVLVPLHDGDRLKICDFLCLFVEQTESNQRPAVPVQDGHSSTVTSVVDAGTSSHLALETHPADRLKAMLQITNSLCRTLELDRLLPQIIDNLFDIFKQADRGFVVVRDEETKALIPKAIKARRERDETSANFSRTIVNRCIDEAKAFLSEDALSDEKFMMSQSISDFRIRSVMCAPLTSADGKTFGVIQLDTQDRGKKFSEDDLQLLMAVSNQAAMAMDNARMHEEQLRAARFEQEMAFAQEVQKGFLPAKLPDLAGYEFFAYYKPARQIGGDFYSFVPPAQQRRMIVAVGDVAGKGVPAALLMARLSGEVRSSSAAETDPARIVSMLNAAMQDAGLGDRFVTFALASLDFENHRLALVNAGHLAPLIRRAGTEKLEEIAAGDLAGLPLGVMPEYDYETVETVLNPGDCVVMFSDGVPDAMSPSGEAFRTDRTRETLRTGPCGATAMGENLLKAIHNHSQGRAQYDDITVVIFGRCS